MIFRSELSKIFSDIKVYWFNYIFGNLNVFFLFLGLYYAFDIDVSSETSTFIYFFGVLIWYFGVHAIDLIAIIIEEEITEGTLEQLMLTKATFSEVLKNRILAQILFDLIKAFFVIGLLVFVLQINVSIFFSMNGIFFLMIFIICMVGLFGIGYLIAGLSLVYKRVSAVAYATNNFILYLSGVLVVTDSLPLIFQILAKLLPLSWGSKTLELLINRDISDELIKTTIFLIFTAIAWSVIGKFSFAYFQKVMKKNGITAGY